VITSTSFSVLDLHIVVVFCRESDCGGVLLRVAVEILIIAPMRSVANLDWSVRSS
jgi:hypothetical protein